MIWNPTPWFETILSDVRLDLSRPAQDLPPIRLRLHHNRLVNYSKQKHRISGCGAFLWFFWNFVVVAAFECSCFSIFRFFHSTTRSNTEEGVH